MEKNLEYYLSLPYTRELIPEPSGIWFVRVKELPNCMSQGNSPEEALRNIGDAMHGWIKGELEDGSPIPEPKEEEEYSGNFRLRVPKSLHRKLVETADDEDISLNTLCVNLISEALGIHSRKIHLDSLESKKEGWQKALRQVCDFLELEVKEETLEPVLLSWLSGEITNVVEQNRPGGLDLVVKVFNRLGKANPFVGMLAKLIIQMQDAMEKQQQFIQSLYGSRSGQKIAHVVEEYVETKAVTTRSVQTSVSTQTEPVGNPDKESPEFQQFAAMLANIQNKR